MSLGKLKSDEFDLVYTSNGVHVWIHDLNAMHTNIHAENGSFWIDEHQDDINTYSQEELASLCDWKSNPLAALPQWLSLCAVK